MCALSRDGAGTNHGGIASVQRTHLLKCIVGVPVVEETCEAVVMSRSSRVGGVLRG